MMPTGLRQTMNTLADHPAIDRPKVAINAMTDQKPRTNTAFFDIVDCVGILDLWPQQVVGSWIYRYHKALNRMKLIVRRTSFNFCTVRAWQNCPGWSGWRRFEMVSSTIWNSYRKPSKSWVHGFHLSYRDIMFLPCRE